MRQKRLFLFAAVPLALLGAATAGFVAHASSTTTKTISVAEKEFRITLSTHKATAGRVRFVVRNVGKYPHALAVSGAGVQKRTAMIAPGKSAVLLATLRSGRYTLWCPVPSHAAKGMKATLTVSTVSATTSTTTTTDSTTTAGTTTTDPGPIPGY
jgi:uncharacterized cupredoxin-like copper-binding protein